MARARNIKPGFFTNDDLAECDPYARILFVGLWTIADREGRMEDKPRKIKAMVLPYDDVDCDKLLAQLHGKNFITRYSVDGNDFIQVNNCQQRLKSDPLTITTNGLILIHLVYSGFTSAIIPALRFCFSR